MVEHLERVLEIDGALLAPRDGKVPVPVGLNAVLCGTSIPLVSHMLALSTGDVVTVSAHLGRVLSEKCVRRRWLAMMGCIPAARPLFCAICRTWTHHQPTHTFLSACRVAWRGVALRLPSRRRGPCRRPRPTHCHRM